MYKKAIAGEIKGFTGIDAPYEEPLNSEINLENLSIEKSVEILINYLKQQCIIK